MIYGAVDLCQQWLRYLLAAWQYQAIASTNVGSLLRYPYHYNLADNFKNMFSQIRIYN